MPQGDERRPKRHLQPLYKILHVQSSGVVWLSPEEIRIEVVGQKAFGISSIPAAWTLPFLSISAGLLIDFLSKGPSTLDEWMPAISEGLTELGLGLQEGVLVRSSGCSEGMSRRGSLHTTSGTGESIRDTIESCLTKLSRESFARSEQIPLLIQKNCLPLRSRGHLSNERRCYEEHRDWMGEIESVDADASAVFQINLRHWRERLTPNSQSPLECTLSSWISEVLKKPADWAYRQGARVHFEWVWNGTNLFLVQADEEVGYDGLDPTAHHQQRRYQPIRFGQHSLRLVTAADAQRFAKIQNVFVYHKLNLPTVPLYILDDKRTIEQLARGVRPQKIADDIAELVKGSLVIRTDIETTDIGRRQLLPRTQEKRNQEDALRWLSEQSKKLVEMKEAGAFLFHNFIPALSSAFAYASPGEPLVQIEGLWGLPEGLYYNSHDKFVVDTLTPKVSVSDKVAARYGVKTKVNFKRYYVAPNEKGNWETCALRTPYDWRASLTQPECRYIAHHSRRIAEEVGYPVSIMWFIGVPKQMSDRPMIPWYHERFDPKVGQASITTRIKTKFDRCFVVQTTDDVRTLNSEKSGGLPLRRIRVQPQEEALLRDKNTLKNIGEAAKKNDAVIVLEGAVLSHAYYQLQQTGAVVEVVHPFDGFAERVVFRKLVRDKVPDIIRARKERAIAISLDPETHIRALREKLIEEAFELLDAKDLDSVIAEMADVETVIQALLKLYRVSKRKLELEMAAKRKQRGGFEKGIVLLETESLLPTAKLKTDGQLQLEGIEDDTPDAIVVGQEELLRRISALEKHIDRHVTLDGIELTAATDIPVTKRAWEVETKSETTEGAPRYIVSGAVRARREGSQWKIEIAVRVQNAPPELL